MSDTRDEPCEIDFDGIVDDREMSSIIVHIGDRRILVPRGKIIELDLERKVITLPEWLALARDLV